MVTLPHATVVPRGVLGRPILVSLLNVRREDVLGPLLPHLEHYVELVQYLEGNEACQMLIANEFLSNVQCVCFPIHTLYRLS